MNKIKRANFVAIIQKKMQYWEDSQIGNQKTTDKTENSLIINWFEGDKVPQSVEDILLDENTNHPEETTEVNADSDEDDGIEASSDEYEEKEFWFSSYRFRSIYMHYQWNCMGMLMLFRENLSDKYIKNDGWLHWNNLIYNTF